MGRSVSYATGSKWVLYAHLDRDEGRIFACRKCGHEHERDDATEPDECEECGNVGFTCHERYPDWLVWDDFLGNLRATFKAAFRSLEACEEWLDREDRAVLENRHVWIGVSEYCGLVSVWCKPKDGDWRNDYQTSPLALHWAESIEAKAARLLDGFTTRLNRLGTFSNGEGVYTRARA